MAYTFVPKIFVNGQFYLNLSSKMWSRVFLEHSVHTPTFSFELCISTKSYVLTELNGITITFRNLADLWNHIKQEIRSVELGVCPMQIFIFDHVTFIQFEICCCVQNFMKI